MPNGVPVGIAAARSLRAALPKVVAVVRPDDAVFIDLLINEGIKIVPCADADQGLSASLRCGILASVESAGWIIALADMPGIQISTIASVHEALRAGALLAAPFYRERSGHPVGFSSTLRDELLTLTGDRGARPVLERHAAQLLKFVVDDPGVLQDVDTPEDLPTS